jgi:tRNA 5-methylaminomethyl-2-thiouridine biosynthesis bifunctional protein
MAYVLAQRGWTIRLIEEQSSLANGASANQQAVFFPKLSAYKQPLTEFMLSAFLYASKIYKPLLKLNKLGELQGSLILAYNKKEQTAQEHLKSWLQAYPELGELLNAEEASNKVGLPVNHSGLFIPLSGWIDSPQLCKKLISHKNITVSFDTKVDNLLWVGDHWRLNDIFAEVVILANGHKLNIFEQTKQLPIKSIRGQMTAIKPTHASTHLKIPLCAQGHVVPARAGFHSIGASYGLNDNDTRIRLEDDVLNIEKLNQLAPETIWSKAVLNSWAGVRASTPDYLPFVGPIPDHHAFLKTYSGLESNSRRWIPTEGPYYQGLYACSGFGSRGLTTIPLCAEFLASLINNEPSILPRNLIQALSPARFLKRNITRGLV